MTDSAMSSLILLRHKVTFFLVVLFYTACVPAYALYCVKKNLASMLVVGLVSAIKRKKNHFSL